MGEKKTIIVAACVLVVLLAAGFLWTWNLKKTSAPSATGSSSEPGLSATMAPVPANVTVPNKGDQDVATGVAVPQDEVVAGPSSTSMYRSFNISIDGQKFVPDTVVVNEDDVVNLEISAVDANYGFTQPDYGFNVPIPQGKTQKVQFEAVATGTFTFYCSSCGGPSKGPVGKIIVAD